MESSVNLAEIVIKLKCDYCSDTLSDPRMLHCKHQYCKRCLDNLLDFRTDGSATIRCPKGCTKVTRISSVDTTNDLDVDYRVKEIVEMLSEKVQDGKEEGEDDRPTCETCTMAHGTKCSMSYCVPCQKMKCENCDDPHDGDILTGNPFLPIKFDKKEKRWTIVCEEHSTVVDSMCCSTVFVCVYCRNRKHKGDINCEPLDVAEESLTKLLNKKLKFAQDYENARNTTNKNISTIISTFEDLLKIKKLKRVDDYVKHLNAEEEKLKEEFNLLTQEHTKFYNTSDPSNYIRRCLQMKRLELLLNKTDIIVLAQRQHRLIRETTVSLTDSLTDSLFKDERPLGCLNVVSGDHVPIEKSINSFRSELPDDHMEEPSLIRSVFAQSPHLRSYIKELGKAIRETEPEPEATSSGNSTTTTNNKASSSRRRSKRRVKEKIIEVNGPERKMKTIHPPCPLRNGLQISLL